MIPLAPQAVVVHELERYRHLVRVPRGERVAIRAAPRPWLRVARISGPDEPAADGVAHELDAVAHPELGQDVGAVALHGLRR